MSAFHSSAIGVILAASSATKAKQNSTMEVSNNGVTYSQMVSRLMKSPDQLLAEKTAFKCALEHAGIGIAGEAGEIIDSIKKHSIYDKPLDYENMLEELGDMEFYLENIRTLLGLSREQVLASNMMKLAKRYGPDYGYTNEKAQARADKQTIGTSAVLAEADPNFFCNKRPECAYPPGHMGQCSDEDAPPIPVPKLEKCNAPSNIPGYFACDLCKGHLGDHNFDIPF